MFKVFATAFLAAIASAVKVQTESHTWSAVDIEGLVDGKTEDGQVMLQLFVDDDDLHAADI